jgi:hypothetical protein
MIRLVLLSLLISLSACNALTNQSDSKLAELTAQSDRYIAELEAQREIGREKSRRELEKIQVFFDEEKTKQIKIDELKHQWQTNCRVDRFTDKKNVAWKSYLMLHAHRIQNIVKFKSNLVSSLD